MEATRASSSSRGGLGGRQHAAGRATPRTGTPKVATLLSCTVAEVAKRLNVAAAPTCTQPPDADALERWREGVRGLPEPLRPLVASQLHYRALVQLVGELAWAGSADTDFHTLIGSIKQEEDVYRYWHWAVDSFPADNGLLFDVFDESCLEARLCRSYAPPPPSLLKDDGLVIAPQRRPDSRPPADIVHRWLKLYDDGLTTDSATFRARFVLAMRHKLNVLDSSIRFGEKMKWSRVFKYQERGLGCNLPMHIRLHGHGGLGQGWLERGVPQGGSLGQVYHLMAMAKLVLLKRHLVGDVFPQTGSGEYFRWSSRWPLGVSQGRHGRSSPSQVADALMSRLSREARARYEGVWQRLGERAIALDGDPFDEGKNPHYDAYPVALSMNLDDVHRALGIRGYHVHPPMAPGSEMADLTTTPYADSSFQCFKMDAVVPGAQGEALPPSVPASPYLDVNTGLASVRYVVETHSMELPDFWERTTQGNTPLDVAPFELSGSRWVLSFEALGGQSRRELVFFRLRWLGFAHGEGAPSPEYRGDWCRANFLLSFNPLDQSTGEEGCSPFTYDGSWVFGEGEESAYYEDVVFGCHLEQGVASPIDGAAEPRWGISGQTVYGHAGLRTAHVQLTVQVVDVAAPVLVW